MEITDSIWFKTLVKRSGILHVIANIFTWAGFYFMSLIPIAFGLFSLLITPHCFRRFEVLYPLYQVKDSTSVRDVLIYMKNTNTTMKENMLRRLLEQDLHSEDGPYTSSSPHTPPLFFWSGGCIATYDGYLGINISNTDTFSTSFSPIFPTQRSMSTRTTLSYLCYVTRRCFYWRVH